MKKTIKLIAIVLALTMLSLPVLGQMKGGMDAGRNVSDRNNPGMMGSSNNGPMHQKAGDMYDNGSRMRNNAGIRGMGFMHRGDNNYGSYVTFTVDNTTGSVLNFGIAGTAIFDSINIQGFDFKTSTTDGAETKIFNKNGSIVIHIHDNPAAVIQINADNATLIFNLSTGVSATQLDTQNNIAYIKAGNITAVIVSEQASSINIAGSQVIINSAGNTIFRASPVNMPHDSMEDQFMGEVAAKRAGAEVSVGESDNSSIVNYSDDMNVTVESIQSDRMRMMVDSSNHSGKFILMNLDNTSLTWIAGQNIILYLDNKPMKEVMTEQELYDASESSFWLNMTGGNKMEALMYIANFSTHQVDVVVGTPITSTLANTTHVETTTAVETTTSAATPKTPGFEIALGALGTLAAAYMMRRRV